MVYESIPLILIGIILLVVGIKLNMDIGIAQLIRLGMILIGVVILGYGIFGIFAPLH